MQAKPRNLITLGLAVVALLAVTGLKDAFGPTGARDYVQRDDEPRLLLNAAQLGEHMGFVDGNARRELGEPSQLARRESAVRRVPSPIRARWETEFISNYQSAWDKERAKWSYRSTDGSPNSQPASAVKEIPAYSPLASIKVGMTKTKVRELIGAPVLESEMTWYYQNVGFVHFLKEKVWRLESR
jgi:hypothetical protein